MSQSKIRILDDRLISQIAAGEVVERPASVVKELVENALDAEATSIEVELEQGGIALIRVIDDGGGMSPDDALLAFERHATSKIAALDDLERIATLGFRGEALSSIAAVARVELRSAPESGIGNLVRAAGGVVVAAEPVARPRGTSVEVADLFYNVPARRKFLKAVRTELRRSSEVVQGYALARPEVRFTLRHGGRKLLQTTTAAVGPQGARERVAEIFGGSLAEDLAEIPATGEGAEVIWGLVGGPGTTRGRRYFTFVNRRLVRDRAVLATFYRAVREEWKSEDFPALFLFMDLPPDTVDVNVHPQKTEVRFRDARLLERVAATLRDGLSRALGEATAPLRQPLAGPAVPFVWEGMGEVPRGRSFEIRERGSIPASAELADVAFAPPTPAPVWLSGRSGESRRLRLLGQYKGSIILLEGPAGLLLVDQHAAHERVLYERLRQATAAETIVSQDFIEPLIVELGASESLRLAELEAELGRCGFGLREMSGNHWALTGAPAMLRPEQAQQMVLALVTDPLLEEGDAAVRDRLLHALTASLSCRAAVKIHRPLAREEMQALVQELFAADQPYACPHGRPIVLEMTDADLERRFGRR